MPKRKDKPFGSGHHVTPILPKTDNQQRYYDALRSCPQVFATGPAGTGKTWLPTAYAADQLRNKCIAGIVLTRPNVPAGPSLGFFPGELEEKMAPWVVPFIEVIKERCGETHTEYYLKKKTIDIVPFEVMRGRTFRDAIVIVDEAQNLTPIEMNMVVTRIGEEAQLIVTGDLVQQDIKGDSGLQVAIEAINRDLVDAEHIEFTADDIVRGGITKQWVKAWSKVHNVE